MVTGVEALVRWQHPVRGLLTPDRFLALFEQSGLMGPLAIDVLSQAPPSRPTGPGTTST